VRSTTFAFEDYTFRLFDPDESTLRETIPGHDYEPAVSTLLKSLLNERGAVFLDVGSLYGYFAILAHQLNPRIEIHAFEPNPAYFQTLNENIQINGSRVQAHNLALSDREETLEFQGKTFVIQPEQRERAWTTLRRFVRSLARREAGSKHRDAGVDVLKASCRWLWSSAIQIVSSLLKRPTATRLLRVPCQTLDAWMAGGVRPTVAKIDVHGAEIKILRGMKRALSECMQHLIIEVHAKHMIVDGEYHEIVDILEGAGFDIFEMRDFRTNKHASLVPLVGDARERFIDAERWSITENIEMRMLYARKRLPVEC
jgi:FkbM family methyltransferase